MEFEESAEVDELFQVHRFGLLLDVFECGVFVVLVMPLAAELKKSFDCSL